jgi:hypothetical protein
MTHDEQQIREALRLIKSQITEEELHINHTLHQAVGLIVDVARRNGLLPRSLTPARHSYQK